MLVEWLILLDSGLSLDKARPMEEEKVDVPAEVMALVQERAEAKKAKDWAKADEIRAKITELGYVVTDTKEGPKVTKA